MTHRTHIEKKKFGNKLVAHLLGLFAWHIGKKVQKPQMSVELMYVNEDKFKCTSRIYQIPWDLTKWAGIVCKKMFIFLNCFSWTASTQGNIHLTKLEVATP